MDQRAYMAAYRAARREEARVRSAQWRANNKAREKIMTAAYREANRDVLRARYRALYEKNREARKALAAAYKLANRDKYRVYHRNRKARSKGKLSPDIVSVLTAKQGGKCRYCPALFAESGHHLDHVMPLARGGLNVDANMQLLCPRCNLKKGARHPDEFAAA